MVRSVYLERLGLRILERLRGVGALEFLRQEAEGTQVIIRAGGEGGGWT